MKKFLPLKSSLSLLALALLTFGLWPATANAYIDPGTGSFVVQGIIAVVVGAGFAIKLFWHKIITMFTGKSPVEDEDDE